MCCVLACACAPAPFIDDSGTESGELPATQFVAPLEAEFSVSSDAGGMRSLIVRADVLHLCAEQGGLRQFSIAGDVGTPLAQSPNAPQSCIAMDIDASQTRLALSDGDTVHLFSLASDGAATWQRSFDAPAKDVLWIDGTRLALAQGELGLSTWQESGETWSKLADAGETNIVAEGLAHLDAEPGSALAVASGRAGLRTYALEAGVPTPMGGTPLDGYALRVAVQGTRAYVASLDAVSELDVSGASPLLLSSQASQEVALDLAANDEWLAVADFRQVQLLARSDEASPRAHAISIPGGEQALTSQQARVYARTMSVAFDEAGQLWAANWDGAERLRVRDEASPHGFVSARELHFGQVSGGANKVLVMAIENRGDAALTVDRVEFTSGRVSTTQGPWTIEPAQVLPLELNYRSDGKAFDAQAWIVSDDPHEQVRKVGLVANRSKLDLGDEMPDFVEVGRRGELVTRAQFEGKVVMMCFFASWCSACNDEFPGYENDLWRDLAASGDSDLSLVGLGRESAARIDGFAATHGVTFALSIDEELYDKFERAPGSVYALEYVFDREGKLRFFDRGAEAQQLRPELEALLAE